MAAEEHLQPRQFGPGGKYTTRPLDMWNPRTIEAVHTNSGRRIGAMTWFPPLSEHERERGGRHVQGSPDPSKPAIYKVAVSKPMRRKGIASAMLDHARDIAPGLQHSGRQALTEDGAAWAQRRP